MINELNAIQEAEPKKFAKNIKPLIEIAETYILEWDDNQKFEIVDIIIQSLETHPSVLKKNMNMVERLFDLICRVMANISDTVPETWFYPPIDYAEDDL